MRLHHLSAGTMCPISSRLVNGTGGVLEPGKMVCHCIVAESNDGLVLVDTGIGLGDMGRPSRLGRAFVALTRPTLDPELTAVRQIEKLGFSAKDVRHVVLTHMDLDHAGGIGDFPHATIHLSKDELAAAMAPDWRERNRYVKAQWAHGPNWATHAIEGDRWKGFDAVRPIAGTGDDVLLIPLEGHTRGHAGVALRSGDGWVLHAGDAYFFHGEMQRDPWCTPGLALFQSIVAADDRRRRENQARLRELVLGNADVRVVSAHDPLELEAAQRTVKSEPAVAA